MGQSCSGDAERKPKARSAKVQSPPRAPTPISRHTATSPSSRRGRSERAGSLPQSRSAGSATEQTPAPSAQAPESASCSPEAAPQPRLLVPPLPAPGYGVEDILEAASSPGTRAGCAWPSPAAEQRRPFGTAAVSRGRARTHAPPRKPGGETFRRTETRRGASGDEGAGAAAGLTATNAFADLLSGAGQLLELPPTTALPSASEPANFRDAGKAVDALWAAPVARRSIELADRVEQQRDKLAAAALVAPLSPARAGSRSADKRPQRPAAGEMRRAAKAAEGRRRELEDSAAVLLRRAPLPVPVEETITEDLANARFLHLVNCDVWHADLQRAACSDMNLAFVAAQGGKSAAEAPPPPPPQLGLTLPDGSAADGSLNFSKWDHRRALPTGSAARTAAPAPALREPPVPTAQRRAAGLSHGTFAPAAPPLQGAGRRVRQAASRLPWR
eukprot:TRINITY_DN2161_c0_g2_i5.p1 TRINITY_DN2161_c0_g2~~TRINITY_DN2161_c0_g2_i5.p1  ORF type:complete len:479 (+),score=88.45 TRINITY_DN2161_c0_g2_i5:104-1438(+)